MPEGSAEPLDPRRSDGGRYGDPGEPATQSAGGLSRGIERLVAFVAHSRHLVVLTGAGCSTESGIPDYRDANGEWKSRQPMNFARFIGDPSARRRYWSRSAIGWRSIQQARPNDAHLTLASLERAGHLAHLITQNVDGLHQKAGSSRVTDLHGRLDEIECLKCHAVSTRAGFQETLERLNPGWSRQPGAPAPDGDADVDADPEGFLVPPCKRCGGALKPRVVFFGENVPSGRAEQAHAQVSRADALLIVGSSLMVWSGYRLVREAVRRGVPVAALNAGRTRADAELTFKVWARCGRVLPRVARRLEAAPPDRAWLA